MTKIALNEQKNEVYFNVFYSECNISSRFTLKDINKRAIKMKFTSMFFTASAVYLRGLPSKI